MWRIHALVIGMVALCSCQYSVVYQFYNATDENVVLDGNQFREMVQKGAFSKIYDYRTVGQRLEIASGSRGKEYEVILPDFVYMHSTRKPDAQMSSIMMALMIIDNDEKIRLGDIDSDGHARVVSRQSKGYPLQPIARSPSEKW